MRRNRALLVLTGAWLASAGASVALGGVPFGISAAQARDDHHDDWDDDHHDRDRHESRRDDHHDDWDEDDHDWERHRYNRHDGDGDSCDCDDCTCWDDGDEVDCWCDSCSCDDG